MLNTVMRTEIRISEGSLIRVKENRGKPTDLLYLFVVKKEARMFDDYIY